MSHDLSLAQNHAWNLARTMHALAALSPDQFAEVDPGSQASASPAQEARPAAGLR